MPSRVLSLNVYIFKLLNPSHLTWFTQKIHKQKYPVPALNKGCQHPFGFFSIPQLSSLWWNWEQTSLLACLGMSLGSGRWKASPEAPGDCGSLAARASVGVTRSDRREYDWAKPHLLRALPVFPRGTRAGYEAAARGGEGLHGNGEVPHVYCVSPQACVGLPQHDIILEPGRAQVHTHCSLHAAGDWAGHERARVCVRVCACARAGGCELGCLSLSAIDAFVPDHSLLRGPVLCSVGNSTFSLVSTH